MDPFAGRKLPGEDDLWMASQSALVRIRESWLAVGLDIVSRFECFGNSLVKGFQVSCLSLLYIVATPIHDSIVVRNNFNDNS